MPASQIQGATTLTAAEVETNTRALRGVLRPTDFASLGTYCVAGNSGVMAATIGTNALLFAFRWSNTNVCLLRRVLLSAAGHTTAFTAGPCLFDMALRQGFRASASGGTALTPSGNANKLRTSMGTSLVTDVRIASTAALTAGTYIAAQIFARTAGVGLATAGKTIVGPGIANCSMSDSGNNVGGVGHVLYEARPGEYPVMFAQDEGFTIATNSGTAFATTGTWSFAVTVQWEERAAEYA